MAKPKVYSKLSVQAFLDELGAATASPGGGAAAALVGATACALLEMVHGINSRKQRTENRSQKKKLKKIRTRLLALMTEDAKAYGKLKAALKKKLSLAQRDQVYLKAAYAPVEICECCVQIAIANEEEKTKTSLWLMSDWRETKILARTAFYAAMLNIEINLNEIKDKAIAGKARQALNKLQAQMDALYAKD